MTGTSRLSRSCARHNEMYPRTSQRAHSEQNVDLVFTDSRRGLFVGQAIDFEPVIARK